MNAYDMVEQNFFATRLKDRGRAFWTVFFIVAVGWLPLVIIVQTLIRFGGLPQELDEWLFFAMLVPAGVFLPLSGLMIWGLGHRKTAWVATILLAPITALYSLVGGLLGPLGILLSGFACSLPLWLLYGVIRLVSWLNKFD